ncbi:MAG: hypothetical protein ACLGIP_07510 [Alphaproteobacteria bacterium]
MVHSMKPKCASVMICLLLALATAIGGVAQGRAAGLAVVAAGLTELVICADGDGPKTVRIARDGTPVELPHCTGVLCEDCLQAGSLALLVAPPVLAANNAPRDTFQRPRHSLHLPVATLSVRSRAPPLAADEARKPLP